MKRLMILFCISTTIVVGMQQPAQPATADEVCALIDRLDWKEAARIAAREDQIRRIKKRNTQSELGRLARAIKLCKAEVSDDITQSTEAYTRVKYLILSEEIGQDIQQLYQALLFAIQKDDLQFAKELMCLQVDRRWWRIDRLLPKAYYDTCVALAAKKGNPKMLSILLMKKSKFVQYVKNRGEALACAIEAESPECVRILLENGADSNGVADKEPLLIKAVQTGDEKIVRQLLQYGASKVTVNSEGMNAYDIALRTWRFNLLELLQ